jgi:hypothetical protein
VTQGVTTPAGPVGSRRPVRRAVAVGVIGLGIAAGAAAITMLSLILRSVATVGGSCADAGPSASAQPCPSDTGTTLLLVFGCAVLCLVAVTWGASVLDAPMPLPLAWPALFLTLGWNFLWDGFDPPMGEDLAVGAVVSGVFFALLGVAALGLWLSAGRDARA